MMERDFFELYEEEGAEVAKIVGEANAGGDDKSNNSAQVAQAISNLKRKRTLDKKEMGGDARIAINELDDNYNKIWTGKNVTYRKNFQILL